MDTPSRDFDAEALANASNELCPEIAVRTETYERLDRLTGGFLTRIDEGLRQILRFIHAQGEIMSDLSTIQSQIADEQQQLDAAVAAFTAEETAVENSLTAVSGLLSQIAATQTTALQALKDQVPHMATELNAFTASTAHLQTVQQAIDGITASLSSASAPAAPSTPPPAAPPVDSAPPVDTAPTDPTSPTEPTPPSDTSTGSGDTSTAPTDTSTPAPPSGINPAPPGS